MIEKWNSVPSSDGDIFIFAVVSRLPTSRAQSISCTVDAENVFWQIAQGD
jgi:hypothetical protein